MRYMCATLMASDLNCSPASNCDVDVFKSRVGVGGWESGTRRIPELSLSNLVPRDRSVCKGHHSKYSTACSPSPSEVRIPALERICTKLSAPKNVESHSENRLKKSRPLTVQGDGREFIGAWGDLDPNRDKQFLLRHVPWKYLHLLSCSRYRTLPFAWSSRASRAMPPQHPHPSMLDLVVFVSLLIMGGLTYSVLASDMSRRV